MKYFILMASLFLFSNNVLANNSFADYFEYESSFMPAHADDITQYFTSNSSDSIKQRINLYKTFNDDLNKQIKENPKKAVLWFSKGLNFKNRLLALEQSQNKKNRPAIINQTVNYMHQAFVKAMQLDQQPKKKLTAIMYGTIKHSLESNERITALQNELALGGSGDNETSYWFSHWDVIGSLQDEGRFDEAEDALYTMKKEMKVAGLDQGDFKKIYQKAKSNLAKDLILSPEKEKKIMDSITTKMAQPKSSQKTIFEGIQSKLESYWLLVLLNIFVIISLIIAFIRREKD